MNRDILEQFQRPLDTVRLASRSLTFAEIALMMRTYAGANTLRSRAPRSEKKVRE